MHYAVVNNFPLVTQALRRRQFGLYFNKQLAISFVRILFEEAHWLELRLLESTADAKVRVSVFELERTSFPQLSFLCNMMPLMPYRFLSAPSTQHTASPVLLAEVILEFTKQMLRPKVLLPMLAVIVLVFDLDDAFDLEDDLPAEENGDVAEEGNQDEDTN